MSRPKVIVYQTASVDGRLTLAPDTLLLYGDPRWEAVAGSSEGVYRRILQAEHPQAILEGSGSFMLEGTPSEPLPPAEGDPAALYEDYLPEEIIHPDGPRFWMTVVDSRGRVRWMYKEFPGEDWLGFYLLVLVSRHTSPEYLAYLRRERVPYLVAGTERVDLPAALDKLAAKLDVRTLVSTAGGKLNGALLRAGLVDELNLDFFPALIGGTDTPSLFDAPALGPEEQPTRLERLSCEPLPNGPIRLRYRVIR